TRGGARGRKSGSRSGERRLSRPRAASRAASKSELSSASASPASAQSRSVPVRGAAEGEDGVRYARNASALCFARRAARLHQPSLSRPASSSGWGPPVTNRSSSVAARSYWPTRPRLSPSQKPTARASTTGAPLDRRGLHDLAEQPVRRLDPSELPVRLAEPVARLEHEVLLRAAAHRLLERLRRILVLGLGEALPTALERHGGDAEEGAHARELSRV